MTNFKFNRGEGHWQLIIDSRLTNVGVDTRRGYALYKRESNEMNVADRLGDLIGKRITQQWDEQAALAEIEKRLAE